MIPSSIRPMLSTMRMRPFRILKTSLIYMRRVLLMALVFSRICAAAASGSLSGVCASMSVLRKEQNFFDKR